MFGKYPQSTTPIQKEAYKMHCVTLQHMYLLCHVVEGTRSVYVCLYSGHSACNLGWPVLTLNLSSCDLRPQFLITSKVFVTLCDKNQFVCLCKSPVICTCYFKKRPRVSFDSCCLAFIFMRLIFTSIGSVSAGLSINTLCPHRTNNTDIKCFFYISKMLPQIKPEHTSLFVWVILKLVSDTICIGHILLVWALMGITRGTEAVL